MRRRQILSLIGLSSTSTLAACSETYEEFQRKREYPNIQKQLISEASEYVSQSANAQTKLMDFRTKTTATITMKDNILSPTFEPNIIAVQPNTEVTWVNKIEEEYEREYKNSYTIYSDSPPINVDIVQPDESFKYTFTNTGLCKYKCKVYDGDKMRGCVIVTDSEPA